MLVWTTTPWTLTRNEAVAVAPEVTYVRAKLDDETLIVAAPLLERVLGEEAEILDHIPGVGPGRPPLQGPRSSTSPIARRRGFPIVAGDFVTTEDGTGLVHIAPAFGEDDYAVAAENGIFDPTKHTTLYNPVAPDGKFDNRVVGFEGRFVKDPEVTRGLIDDLAERGLLFREQVYEHAYPHCWRCGTPLLYYAKSSWYVATSGKRDDLLANNEQIGWHPEHIKHGRFGKWLENNVDWALSRDRYWGTPLPIWECGGEDCHERACIGSVAELRERAGGDVPDDLHRPYIDDVVMPCGKCGGEMRRVDSVIDTWYDSGAMPFAQFHYPFENEEQFEERFPADFICEAIDQTRGWFYTLLAESTLLFDSSSYRNCVCLGLILDPEGQKMSKSRGNVVEPWDVISTHGADAFRWYYLTSQQPWSGYRFSVETVGESVRQFLLTLWNTYSFWVLYANAEGLGPSDFAEEPDAAGTDLDRWVISRLQSVVARVTELMDDFDCTAAGREIAAFVEELSNWYVRLSRRRFWDGRPGRLRDPASLPARDLGDAGAVHTVPRRRDPPQPRRRRGGGVRRAARLGPPPRLPGGQSRHRRPRPRVGDGRGPPHRRARPRRPRPGEGQGAPAAAPRGDRRQRRRARGDLGSRRPRHRRAQCQGARLRLRGGGAGQLFRQAQLPCPRPQVREADAAGRRGDRARSTPSTSPR